jgi:hypothetical protein
MYPLYVKSVHFTCSLMAIPCYYNHESISVVMRHLEVAYRLYVRLERNAICIVPFVTELILQKFQGRWQHGGEMASWRPS